MPAPPGDLYFKAAEESGIPVNVLVAIAGAESAWHPWALNVSGREIYCASQEAALAAANAADDVDIGLMQINYRIWGERLGLSKAQLLDPLTNLMAGAKILKACLGVRPADAGPAEVWKCIAIYHSRKTGAGARYNRRVYNTYLNYLLSAKK